MGEADGKEMPTWRNWQTRTVQVRVPQGLWVQLPPSVPFFNRRGFVFGRVRRSRHVRVWHNGCAPAFQAGYTGSTPVTRSKKTSRAGGVAERSNAVDCKSTGIPFGGSNPPPTTIFLKQPSTDGFFIAQFSDFEHIPNCFRPLFPCCARTKVGWLGSLFGLLPGLLFGLLRVTCPHSKPASRKATRKGCIFTNSFFNGLRLVTTLPCNAASFVMQYYIFRISKLFLNYISSF